MGLSDKKIKAIKRITGADVISIEDNMVGVKVNDLHKLKDIIKMLDTLGFRYTHMGLKDFNYNNQNYIPLHVKVNDLKL